MYPFVIVAGAVALYFAVAAVRRPRPAEVLAGVLWAAYAVYEYFIANGTLCDANCNIRVDLLLFLPLLAAAAYLAVQEAPSTRAVAVLAVISFGLAAWLASLFGYPIISVIAGLVALIAAVWGIKARSSGRAV